MAKTLNRVTLLGNVGKSPEVKVTAGGTKVATFSIATANRYKNNQGEWVETPEWHNCVSFGSLAEIVEKYVAKGSKLYIEGRIQTRSWDDKESGKKIYRTEVVVSDVTLLGAPKAAKPTDPEEENQVPGYAYTRETGITDDDISF